MVAPQFRHNGPLDAFSPINPGTHQKRPIAQWIDGYGDLEIAAINWAYGSKDNALTFTSYIDYLEINGVTFDFGGRAAPAAGSTTDVVATAGDGQAPSRLPRPQTTARHSSAMSISSSHWTAQTTG